MTPSPDIEKIVPRNRLLARLNERRSRGEYIVFTNGCFDLLHVGHVRYLRAARELGDLLVVGVNDDGSVNRIKGAGRPIHPLEDRLEILAAFPFIDYLVAFETDSVEPLVREVAPDVLVKGGDYRIEEVVGHEFVQSYGGRVVVLAHAEGRSSSETIRRMREGEERERG